MSITLDQLDKIVHSLNNDIHNGYDIPPEFGLVELHSTGYTYYIMLGGFALYDAENHYIEDWCEEAEVIERHCRSRLIDFCNFWAHARERCYATVQDRKHPLEP